MELKPYEIVSLSLQIYWEFVESKEIIQEFLLAEKDFKNSNVGLGRRRNVSLIQSENYPGTVEGGEDE